MMRMKKLILLLIAGLSALTLSAQVQTAPSGTVAVDSIVYRPAAAADAALEGKSIFSVLTGESKGVSVS